MGVFVLPGRDYRRTNVQYSAGDDLASSDLYIAAL
jgi:hypothetical protein